MNKKIIHTVFENQVEKTPNNTAMIYDQNNNIEHITYKYLNIRANSIAYRLLEIENIVHTEDTFIGLFLPNGMHFISSVLGILKAGAVFVPIDILAPNERIEKIVNKASIKTLITDQNNVENLRSIIELLGLKVNIVLVETLIDEHAVHANTKINPQINPPLNSQEDGSAYLMFTSGSTGEPKAILGMQKSLSHFIHWEQKEFAIDESFRISQLAGVTFDVSLRDIFLPLISGATLCIPNSRTDIKYLTKWLSEEKISLMHIVPSLFRLLIKELEVCRYDLSALRYILFAGEALYGSDVQQLHTLYPHIQVVNLYGPSETTLAKIFNRIDPQSIKNPNAIMPLGKPISNSSVLILKNNALAQVKQIGEIHIKTPFRSKGYLHDEALSQKVFIQNPLNDKEDIIYKTGDMGRYLEDGTIEFIGRMDNQIKLNGIRVELEEIQSAVKSYDKIDNAVITHEASASKEIVLICYYVEKMTFDQDDLRDYLIEKIPAYMIPNFFVKLDKFPLNFHGKIDKKALPKPEDLLYRGQAFIEPKTETQKALAAIFSEILRIKKISIDVSFTHLGGNSLNAISAIAKISHNLKVQINIKDFFENPTVEKLAQLIDKEEEIQHMGDDEHMDITPLEQAADYEVSNAQRRLWVLDKMRQGINAYNLPGAVTFDQPLDKKVLKNSLELLIQRHEILRTNFIESNGEVRQILHETSPKNILEIVSLDEDAGAENIIEQYMQEESQKVLDLQNDALFYVKLINDTLLFVNIHHIISDGWSTNVIINELSEIYTALSKGNEPKLEPLSIQYKDYAAWQNRLLENQDFIKQHQNYWHDLLREHKMLHFPTDFPRSAEQTFEGKELRITLDKHITKKLENLAADNTLFTVLFCMTHLVLSKYANQKDLTLGTVVANRGHAKLLNQIGFYVNTLALRLELEEQNSFKEVLTQSKNFLLEAFEHQQYPFDKLVDELDLERDLSQNPLFNIMMIFQNNENTDIRFGDLKSSSKSIDFGISKFDMTLSYVQIDNEIELQIEYNTALFKESTIQRLLNNIQQTAQSIEGDKKLFQIDTLAPEEYKLLENFNHVSSTISTISDSKLCS